MEDILYDNFTNEFYFFYFLGKLPISFEVHPNMVFFVRFGEFLKAKLGLLRLT